MRIHPQKSPMKMTMHLETNHDYPNRIKLLVDDVNCETPEYLADELLLLSEEILSQVSAYGGFIYTYICKLFLKTISNKLN
ncbi:MAG: hypothetical protein ACKO5L_12070 [Bacteroidota bacterium]